MEAKSRTARDYRAAFSSPRLDCAMPVASRKATESKRHLIGFNFASRDLD